MSGIAGADAKCVAEFGAGWSFANTREQVGRIIQAHPQLYYGVFGYSGYDNLIIAQSWRGGDGPANCSGWTTANMTVSGNTLQIQMLGTGTFKWLGTSALCHNQLHLWCCPP